MRAATQIESISTATDTVACPYCMVDGTAESGGSWDCKEPACYRGRVSGWRDISADLCEVLHCSIEQRGTVDLYFADQMAA